MGLEIEYSDGQTPLDEDECAELRIPFISMRAELDEFEQQNIERAVEWTMSRKFSAEKIFTETFVCQLHKRMLGDVWKWAGQFRKTNKNLGCDWKHVATQLKQLNADCQFWLQNNTFSQEEIAIRYKHRIVSIHCFSNGNGRHSRLMADIIVSRVFGQKPFSWGTVNADLKDLERKSYLDALQQADKGELKPLVGFARM